MSNPQNKSKFQAVLDALEAKQAKRNVDTLKQKRTYAEEIKKASPEYKATQAKDQLKDQLKTRRELQEEKRKSTPQEDILRFGQQQKKFRDLAYKERVVTEDDNEGNAIVSMQYIPRPGGAIFKQQEEAYGDSLKLAGLAQQYGVRTPDIRKIDRNRKVIDDEMLEVTKKYMKETSGLNPSVSKELAKKRAEQDLVNKYGKGIIPLLQALKNK